MNQTLLDDLRNIQRLHEQIEETSNSLTTVGFSTDAPLIDDLFKHLDEVIRLVARIHDLTEEGVELIYFYLLDCNCCASELTFKYKCKDILKKKCNI